MIDCFANDSIPVTVPFYVRVETVISNAFYGYPCSSWWWPICACTLKYILVDDTNWDDLLFWDVERGCSLEVVSTFNFETFILTNTVYYEQNN